jgi:threonine/homoserine/homoserine lactone efflux protein
VPGPSMALAFTEGISHKMRGVLPAAFGNVVASLLQGIIAYLVFKSVVSLNENFLLFIQIIGSIYIPYIGYLFVSNSARLSLLDESKNEYKFNYMSNFRMGFLIAFFNPKAILFFVALFPQFIQSIRLEFIYEMICVFAPIAGVALICFMIYGVCGAASLRVFKNEIIVDYVIKLLGALLIVSATLGILDVVL